MLKRLLCPSSRIVPLSSKSSGMQTLPLNLSTPSLPIKKSLAFSVPSNSTVLCSLGSDGCFSFIRARKSLDIVRWLHLMIPSSKTICNRISLNYSTKPSSLTIIWEAWTAFRLKASATTLAFPGWYNNSKSKSFRNFIHRLCLIFNSFWSNRYLKLLWSLKTWNCAP